MRLRARVVRLEAQLALQQPLRHKGGVQQRAQQQAQVPDAWKPPRPGVCVCDAVVHDGYHVPGCPAQRQPFDSVDVSTGRVR